MIVSRTMKIVIIVASVIFVIGIAILLYFLLRKKKDLRYSCNTTTKKCSSTPNGKFSTLNDCVLSCSKKTPACTDCQGCKSQDDCTSLPGCNWDNGSCTGTPPKPNPPPPKPNPPPPKPNPPPPKPNPPPPKPKPPPPKPNPPPPKPKPNPPPPGPPKPLPHPWKPSKPYGPHSTKSGFKIGDFTSEKWTGDGIEASTTNFGFGANTSCGCNGQRLEKQLANLGYVGVATPNWLQSTYNTNVTGSANGESTPKDMRGTDYTSNCSSGPGGCGKCFELTTTDTVRVKGQQNPTAPGKTIKTVVLDTCEDRNAYGNNYQWCVASTASEAANTNNYSGGSPETTSWGKDLRFGTFSEDNGVTTWNPSSDCTNDKGEWTCKNVAGSPIHFDFAIQNLLKDPEVLKKVNPDIDWSTWDNPVVTAKPIQCDPKVLETLQGSCGGLAADGSTPDQPDYGTCLYYCPPFNGAPGSDHPMAEWWGGCDTNWDCSPVNTNCQDTNCCQFGQECVRQSQYYSGCQDKK